MSFLLECISWIETKEASSALVSYKLLSKVPSPHRRWTSVPHRYVSLVDYRSSQGFSRLASSSNSSKLVCVGRNRWVSVKILVLICNDEPRWVEVVRQLPLGHSPWLLRRSFMWTPPKMERIRPEIDSIRWDYDGIDTVRSHCCSSFFSSLLNDRSSVLSFFMDCASIFVFFSYCRLVCLTFSSVDISRFMWIDDEKIQVYEYKYIQTYRSLTFSNTDSQREKYRRCPPFRSQSRSTTWAAMSSNNTSTVNKINLLSGIYKMSSLHRNTSVVCVWQRGWISSL